MLARKSGLTIGELGGVLCDSRLRTSAPGIYAAGDMCEYDSVVHGRVVRIEHEEVAAAQGATAARNMLGADAAHDEVPYFFSDLSDWASLEYLGPALTWDDEQLEGSTRRRRVRHLVPRGRSGARDAERRRRGRPRPRTRAHPGLSAARARPAISATVTRERRLYSGLIGSHTRKEASATPRMGGSPTLMRSPARPRRSPAASRIPGVASATAPGPAVIGRRATSTAVVSAPDNARRERAPRS